MQKPIEFTGLGGCREVGRSAFIVSHAGEHFLLDDGVKLSTKETQYPLPINTNISAVVLSHAHLDHSGDLPFLFHQSNFLVFLSQPTLDLCNLLWRDTIKVSSIEKMEPRFSEREVKRAERYCFPVQLKKKLHITHHASLEFFDAGHIPGSAITKLLFGQKSVVYTGDFRPDETRLHKGADLKLGHCDYLIIESTYGNRNHPPRKETERLFVEALQDTVDRGGWALVPAFAIGRSQEILDILFEYNVQAPIFFDGMCQKAARIILEHPSWIKDAKTLKKALNKAKWVKGEKARQHALKQPSIIVSSAGMMQGGPIVNYAKRLYKDKNSLVALPGFQVKDTPGRILLETGKLLLDGVLHDAAIKVQKFDFSAHASQEELLRAIGKWNPEKIVLVHGDEETALFFQKLLKEKGFDAAVPKAGETIRLC